MARIRLRKKRKNRARLTRHRFIKALKGTGGIYAIISKRLGCTRNTVCKWVSKARQEGDEEILEALQDEIDSVGDIAEQTVKVMMQQRLDMSVASRTAKWYLERRCSDRGYKDKRQITLEGGKNPILTKNDTVVSIKSLESIPLEDRKRLLAAIEEQEKKESNE